MSPRKAARVYVDILEAAFQAQIVKLAELTGWKVYHTHDSRRSQEGFPGPDPRIRRARMIAAELKTRDETTTPEQRAWLEAFAHFVSVQSVLWRPDVPPDRRTVEWSYRNERGETILARSDETKTQRPATMTAVALGLTIVYEGDV